MFYVFCLGLLFFCKILDTAAVFSGKLDHRDKKTSEKKEGKTKEASSDSSSDSSDEENEKPETVKPSKKTEVNSKITSS